MTRERWRGFAGVALTVIVLAFAAKPAAAQPQFPERYSILWFDVQGTLVECTDFVPCTLPKCPAAMFFANKTCDYTDVSGDFATGRTRTTVDCRNIDFGGIFQNTKRVFMDVTCSRVGTAFWRVTPGGVFPPASCAAGVTYKRINQFTNNQTMNEGLAGVTISGVAGARGTCAQALDINGLSVTALSPAKR